MNDKCLDMNEGKKTKCQYLCNENEDFKDIILVMTMENNYKLLIV